MQYNCQHLIIFSAGIPPDGRPVEKVLKFHTALIVTMYVLALVGLVFATVCIVFMVIFRKKRSDYLLEFEANLIY